MTDAFFTFGNNARENADEIASALNESIRVIEDAARKAGGIAVPTNFGEQIARQARQATEEVQKSLREMLDPKNLGAGGAGIKQTNDALSQATLGAFQNVRREIDNILGQLGPDAKASVLRSFNIEELLGEIGHAIVSEARGAYAELRREMGTLLPTLNRLGGRASAAGLGSRLGQEDQLVHAANQKRIDSLYTYDEEGGIADVNEPAILAADKAAAAARERAAAAAEKARKEQEAATVAAERARLASVLADQVGREDPYARALGITKNPESGLPTRRVAGGYEDITDPRQIEQAIHDQERLRKAVEQTQEMMAGGRLNKIEKSPFYVLGNGEAFFEKAKVGGIELYHELTELEGKTLSLARAQDSYNAQIERGVRIAPGPRGFTQGLASGAFGRGFSGGGALDSEHILGNLGQTVGSAARYSLAYGGFYQFIQSGRQALAIFNDYQDSVTDYQVAIGSANGDTSEMTATLMDLSRVLGENVGAAYDAAARSVRAFASDASEAEKTQAGIAGASAAQKISVIANKPLADATGDAIAIGTAYGLSAQQTELLVPDALSNAKRNVGGDPAQISQGLSNFAVAAKEAGYTLQEAADVIALVQSRTDETGQAVATRLTRIIQIASGSTGKGLARDINRTLGAGTIDSTAIPKEQVEQFARAYVAAGRQGLSGLQDQIRAQLGGTSNLKELLPLLEQGGQDQLAAALKKALPGAGESEYERKLNNLIGTLNAIRGSIQNIIVTAANADIFAPFAIGVKTLEPVLHTLETILSVYQQLEDKTLGPILGPVGTTGVEAGLAYAGFRALKRSTFAGEVASSTGLTGAAVRSAGVAPAVRVGADAAVVAADGRHALASNAVAAADARAAETVSLRAGADLRAMQATNGFTAALARADAALIPGLAGLQSGIAGVLPGLLKWGSIISVALLAEAAVKQSAKTDTYNSKELGLLGEVGGTDPTKARNTSDALNSLLAAQKSDTKIFSNFGNGGEGDYRKRLAGEADLLASMSKATEAEKKRADALKTTSVFGDEAGRTTDSIAQAFQDLSERGLSARQQLREYFKALMVPSAPVPGSGEQPNTTTQAVVSAIGAGANKYVDDLGETPSGGAFGAGFLGRLNDFGVPKNLLYDNKGDISRNLNLGPQLAVARQRILDGIKKAGPGLDKQQLNQIAEQAINGIDVSRASGEYDAFNTTKFRATLLESVKKNVKVIQHQASALKPLSPAELQALIQAQGAAVQEADPTDPEAAARQARENLKELIRRRNATGTSGADARRRAEANFKSTNDDGGIGSLLSAPLVRPVGQQAGDTFGQFGVAIRNGRHTERQLLLAQAEDLRKADEARVADSSATTQATTRLRDAKVSFRIAGDDVTLLEGLMESLDRRTVNQIIEYRKEALAVARLAYEHMQHIVEEAQAELSLDLGGPALSGHPGEGQTRPDVSPKLTRQLSETKAHFEKRKKDVAAALKALDYSTITSNAFPDGTAADDHLTARQRAALSQQADRNPDDTVGAARDNLRVARANLAALDKKGKRNTQEYFSALQAVSQAKNGLGDAIAQRTGSIASAAAARTGDPVAAARAQLVAARAQLATQTRGTIGWYQALGSLFDAQRAMGDAVAGQQTAVAQAHASRVGGAIAAAHASLVGARAQLSTARGLTAQAQALGSFFDGQRAMRDAMVQYRNNVDLLRGDSTNPVEQARDALRAARRKLGSDRGQARDVRAEDRVGVDSARNALADSKFQQRFSDMQTAEELGRISFAKYMSYLDHEHDRLSKIKHRTRQQQDQLDSVDKAMKDALNSMDGQFNLGDINTNGLVYQVRRFKAEAQANGSAAQVANSQTVNQTVSIQVDGADTFKVKQIIDNYLGVGGGQTRTIARRKV